MSTVYEKALLKHAEWQGKMGTYLKAPIESREDLNLAYTPGVAQPCIEIHKNKDDVYKYTWKGNTVAVITDGTAVLGLGDIGPEASLPVMEGKCALLKRFGNVDAVPIALNTKDPKEIIQICKALAPAFGGFNLEDISAPRCVEIERALIEALDIPVFHDDQHGTAIVVTAGLINALKLVNKRFEDIKVVVSGAGAAGSSIIRMISKMGVKNILAFNVKGIITKDDYDQYDFLTKELTEIVNPNRERIVFKDAFHNADVFIGVSAPKIVSKEMIQSMAKDAIVFSMANPEPEISYVDAKAAGAYIVGTGRSDSPNQVNNILAFPGLFRGALDCRASRINEEMKLAAAVGISKLISDAELSPEYVIPSAFDPRVSEVVASEVKKAAYETKVARI